MSRRSNPREIPARSLSNRRGIPRASQNPDPSQFGQRARTGLRGNPSQQDNNSPPQDYSTAYYGETEGRAAAVFITPPNVPGVSTYDFEVSFEHVNQIATDHNANLITDRIREASFEDRIAPGIVIRGSFYEDVAVVTMDIESSVLGGVTPAQAMDVLLKTVADIKQKTVQESSPLNPGAPKRRLRLTTEV